MGYESEFVVSHGDGLIGEMSSGWRGQPVVEFIFAATEEAIFVHVLISAKHLWALSTRDMEKILNRSSNHSGDGLPGCCPMLILPVSGAGKHGVGECLTFSFICMKLAALELGPIAC
ncbi:RNA polymerase II transcription mediator [Actinidia rufa]|uniref:RNA polymerase II transcription mediator n=1 Tax=Actinidia rufa TaxID=165716 RepID=A0A7J0EEN9_9ERIC|nr:RNA polymerase II transcription mediator [Actinidia rufa]